MTSLCDKCHTEPSDGKRAYIQGVYYRDLGRACLNQQQQVVSNGAIGYQRRREYEDYAQDTIQPYDAKGPNPEFLRLYPKSAAKVFTSTQIEEMKRKI